MSAPVQFDEVWKSYPRWQPEARTVRGIMSRRMPALMHLHEQRWALRGVSFELAAGESVGLIGPNGAGKSTLLRLGAGLGCPTRGVIRAPSNVASILSLGDTFDPALTGRENALTAAIIAGKRRSEASACLPCVLEFAELGDWSDAPMRIYSEGMKLRLAFGVLTQFEPEVLLLDEVLAVGDVAFEQKCLDHIARLRAGGTTLLLASHDLEQVTNHCDRAVWLDGGAVRADGPAKEVVAGYRNAMMERTIALTPVTVEEPSSSLELGRNRFGSQEVRIDRVAMLDADGGRVSELHVGDPLTVRLAISAPDKGVPGMLAAVSLHRLSDDVKCCDATTAHDGVRLEAIAGRRELVLSYEQLDLEPGDYTLEVGLWASGWRYAFDLHQRVYALRIVGPRQGEGLVRTRHRWELSSAATSASEPGAIQSDDV